MKYGRIGLSFFKYSSKNLCQSINYSNSSILKVSINRQIEMTKGRAIKSMKQKLHSNSDFLTSKNESVPLEKSELVPPSQFITPVNESVTKILHSRNDTTISMPNQNDELQLSVVMEIPQSSYDNTDCELEGSLLHELHPTNPNNPLQNISPMNGYTSTMVQLQPYSSVSLPIESVPSNTSLPNPNGVPQFVDNVPPHEFFNSTNVITTTTTEIHLEPISTFIPNHAETSDQTSHVRNHNQRQTMPSTVFRPEEVQVPQYVSSSEVSPLSMSQINPEKSTISSRNDASRMSSTTRELPYPNPEENSILNPPYRPNGILEPPFEKSRYSTPCFGEPVTRESKSKARNSEIFQRSRSSQRRASEVVHHSQTINHENQSFPIKPHYYCNKPYSNPTAVDTPPVMPQMDGQSNRPRPIVQGPLPQTQPQFRPPTFARHQLLAKPLYKSAKGTPPYPSNPSSMPTPTEGSGYPQRSPIRFQQPVMQIPPVDPFRTVSNLDGRQHQFHAFTQAAYEYLINECNFSSMDFNGLLTCFINNLLCKYNSSQQT